MGETTKPRAVAGKSECTATAAIDCKLPPYATREAGSEPADTRTERFKNSTAARLAVGKVPAVNFEDLGGVLVRDARHDQAPVAAGATPSPAPEPVPSKLPRPRKPNRAHANSGRPRPPRCRPALPAPTRRSWICGGGCASSRRRGWGATVAGRAPGVLVRGACPPKCRARATRHPARHDGNSSTAAARPASGPGP